MNRNQAKILGGLLGTIGLAILGLISFDYGNAKAREEAFDNAHSAYGFMKRQEGLIGEFKRRPELREKASMTDAQGRKRRLTKEDVQKVYREGIARYNRLAAEYNRIPKGIFFRSDKHRTKMEKYIEPNKAL